MRTLLAAGTVALTLSSCAPRRPAPEAAPPPPPPAPAPAPAPAAPGWADAPLSAGDWTYRDEGGVSSAAYGPAQAPVFILRCERSREVSLVRTGAGSGPLIVRTSFGERSLPAAAQPEGLAARLAAADPLLDQMLFSRGRFAVEAQGTVRLVLPAWPEPAKVVEDCRG